MAPTPPSAAAVPPRRVYQVAYSTASDETPRLHHMRDGAATAELMAALVPLGYTYETALNFYPELPLPAEKFSFLGSTPGTLLVLTTRPPLEGKSAGRATFAKGLKHSQNALEEAIFSALEPFFVLTGRYAVDLTREASRWLKPDAQDMAVLTFSKKSHALIDGKGPYGIDHAWTTAVKSQWRQTAGYFVHVDKIPNFPCGLICCFAPGGVENLLFARLVRKRHSAWLKRPVFAFARFNLPHAAEDTPLCAEFLDDQITEDVLAEHWLDKSTPAYPP